MPSPQKITRNAALRNACRVAGRHDSWPRCTLLGVLMLLVATAPAFAGGTRVRVESMTPAGEIASDANLTWTFSKPVASDAWIRKPLDARPVTFTPDIPGVFRWVAADKLRFYPDAQLAPSTEYMADVRAAAVEPHGLRLDGDHEFRFATRRLTIASAFLNFEFDPGVREQVKLIGASIGS